MAGIAALERLLSTLERGSVLEHIGRVSDDLWS